MTKKLVEILEAARKHYEASNIWFALYQESNNEYDWNMCESEDYAARGLLEAYEIITGEKIYPHEIKAKMLKTC